MSTTDELIRKEEEALRKAKEAFRNNVKKLKDAELKRFSKLIDKTDYFKHQFSDDELLSWFNQMIESKASVSLDHSNNQ